MQQFYISQQPCEVGLSFTVHVSRPDLQQIIRRAGNKAQAPEAPHTPQEFS